MMHWMTKWKVANWKKQNKRRIDFYNEKPLTCTDSDANGSDIKCERYQFVGCETDGTILLIDFQLTREQKEAYLYLKLADGRIFTLPNHPGIVREDRNGCDTLSIGNLRFEILVAHSKWRITYNGMLRVVHKPNAMQDNNSNGAKDEFQHVIFNFFWNAASNPIAWPDNWSAEHLLQSLNDCDVVNKLDKWLQTESGFDQCGAMYGQIIIDRSDDGESEKKMVEVNLPGVRRVRFGDANKIGGYSGQSTTVIGVGHDGTVFVLSNQIADNCNEGCFGFVRWANGNIFPIERSEFNSFRFPFASKLNEQIDIRFSTATKLFTPTLQFNGNSSIQVHGGSRKMGYKQTISPLVTDLNGIDVNGLVLCHTPLNANETNKWFRKNVIEQTFSYPSFDPSVCCDKSRLTVQFDSTECQNEALCGGKGSSLAFLRTLVRQSPVNFDVTNGFVLTSAAFLLQLKRHKKLEVAVVELENIAYQRVVGTLADACAAVCDLFKSTELDEEIIVAVANDFSSLQKQFNVPFRVAVRSSAIGEDGSESSAAGQNATYLGVSDIDQVLNAIRNCWASLFTVQSVSYRVHSIQPVRTEMAVVVQSMIPSESAGVLFTHFPLNNDPNKLLITGNFGLGESVVSGSVDPDEFIVNRDLQNSNLTILERKMGDKATRIEMNGNDDVTAATVDPNQRHKYCINDENLLSLCQIGIYLEHCYKSARDIEWAVHKNKIFLLQSRPMTATTAFSAWELLHEFDTPIMSAQDWHTFGNVGEVMPEAITPLTFSTIGSSLNRAMLPMIKCETVSPLYNAIFASSHYRISIDVFNAIFFYVEKAISLTNRVHGLAIFGHEFITDELHRIGAHRNGFGTRRQKLYLTYDLFATMWQNKTMAHNGRKFIETFRDTYDAHNLAKFTSMQNLYDDLTKKIHEMDYVCAAHCSTTKTITGYQFIVFSILAEGNNELSPEYSSDIGLMLGSCKDVESAEIPISLEQIAHLIQNTGRSSEFSAIMAENGVEWLREHCHQAHALFEGFLRKHGHRAFVEFDLATITWGMNPALVIEMLQCTVKSMGAHQQKKHTKKSLTNDEIVAALKSPKQTMTRKMIKTFLPYFQASVQLREQSKSCLIAFIDELRKAYRFLAQKMQHNGLLSDSELIFYLSHQEIGCVLLNERRVELVSRAQRRKRMFPEWKKFRFDEFQFGVMKPLNMTISSPIMTNGNCSIVIVKGTPVCDGNITGRACVVHEFTEVTKIRTGDILIAHSTDIAWSPYFPILAGVVTELGGLISHGAVVAREYGLPCIVGAARATSIINDGDTINMNAFTGIITKIDT